MELGYRPEGSGIVPAAQPCPATELTRVLDVSADPAAIIVEGRYAYVNGAWARMLGWDESHELFGSSATAHVDPRDRARWETDVVNGEAPTTPGTLRLLPRLGGTIHVDLLLAQPVEHDDRRATLVIARHAAERRRHDASLAVTDRLSSVGMLAAGIAHEINNPLAYVTTNLELALEELGALASITPSARVRLLQELLGEAKGGTERVRKIVRGLKTFSRFEDEERLTTIDVHSVLDLSTQLAWGEVKHHAVVHSHFGDVPNVVGDESRLAQVFINVLVNAAQALASRPRAENTIGIETRTNADGDAEIRFVDNGPGIPEPIRSRIFEPFFTTKPAGEGTGLGLSIAHTIVTSMGGTMAAIANEGPGVTFVITLPRASDGPFAEAARNTGLPPAAPLRARVLVIDDEPAVARSLERALGRDHDVMTTIDPHDALGMIDGGAEFDVILCDLMMPTMSGMEVHAQLAARSPELAARIVFVTGGAVTREARDFLENVKNARVDKPVKTKTLRTLIATLVSERDD